MQLDQIKAIITGGASGLGYATAQHLVTHGSKVALLDINKEKALSATRALGEATSFHLTDVSSEDAVASSVATAAKTMGGLNVVLNCAGVLASGRVLGKAGPMPLSAFTSTLMVNLVGSFNVAKTAAAHMQHNAPGKDNERGVIIHTASIAAYEGQIGQTAYAASKAGLVGMTLPMARELAQWGIRVASIAPGLFQTPMASHLSETLKEALATSVPYPSRLGQAEEFAQTVAFILVNCYINGETIRLDGALRLTPA